MKNFSNIQEALDFAAGNQRRLKFPFECRCNGFPVRVLSPQMARTLSRERPNLVATRKVPGRLALGYIVSAGSLKEILHSLAMDGMRYSLRLFGDNALVTRWGPGIFVEYAFPIVKHAQDEPEELGTFILLEPSGESKERHKFWLPLEMRLLHSSINPMA
jgi:hypothetical protein